MTHLRPGIDVATNLRATVALWQAVLERDRDGMRMAVKAGADLNLMLDREELFSGEDIIEENAPDDADIATLESLEDLVREFEQACQDKRAGPDVISALSIVIARSDVVIMTFLVRDLGADPNAYTGRKTRCEFETPVHWAIDEGDSDVLQALFHLGARPTLPEPAWEFYRKIRSSGNHSYFATTPTPLVKAIENESVALTECLLRNRADPNEISPDRNAPPSVVAAYDGNPQMFDLLARYQADLSIPAHSGDTAQSVLGDWGHIDALDLVESLTSERIMLAEEPTLLDCPGDGGVSP